MQLILDAEATISIQSKMSGINEEMLDGNLAKNLIDNFSNDLPHGGSGVLKDVSLIDDDKKKELLDIQDTSEKNCNTNENLSLTLNQNNTRKSKQEEIVNSSESIDHQNCINTELDEKKILDLDIASGQAEKKIDLPKGDIENLNFVAIKQPFSETCSNKEDDDILKLDSSFDNSLESIGNDTTCDTTDLPELENILAEDINKNEVENQTDEEKSLEHVSQNVEMCNIENELGTKIKEVAVLENVAENYKWCNLENQGDNNMDEDAILENAVENSKMCNLENQRENNMDEDAILENVEENSKMCNLENPEENNMDEDGILENVVENSKMCNLENPEENNMDVDEISENVVENSKMCNLENPGENNIDEDAILENVVENSEMSNLENQGENDIDEDAILEDIEQNDKISNLENESSLENKTNLDAVVENVAKSDNISNLEIKADSTMDEVKVLGEFINSETISNSEIKVKNKIVENLVEEGVVGNDNTTTVENIIYQDKVFDNDNINEFKSKPEEINILEKAEKDKNEYGGNIENENEDNEIKKKLSGLKDNDVSNDENEKIFPDNEESLAENGINIVNSLTDQNDQSNFKSCHAVTSEKSECKGINEDKKDTPSVGEQTADNQNERQEEKHVNEDENTSKDTKNFNAKNCMSHRSKLSNTLQILSDDEDELTDIAKVIDNVNNYNQSISLVDDDDVMLIEEDAGEKEENNSEKNENLPEVSAITMLEKPSPQLMEHEENIKNETVPEKISVKNNLELMEKNIVGDVTEMPLLPINVLKNYKKNLADMTREELEEFCISKIVESVVDRSNLGDIKAQLKITVHTLEEYKKKLMVITKQTRDLQVILKSVQEEQKKPSANPVTPLKLTRSVGMQVLMTDKAISKKRQQSLIPSNNSSLDKSNRNNATNSKTPKNNQQIPVPRLVPAAMPASKATSLPQAVVNNAVATKSPQTNVSLVNGLKVSPPAQKPEKRTRVQTHTVDLTDDEPPPKIAPKSSPTPPVRLVPPQNLLAPQRQPFSPNVNNSPRKVYIPISNPQTQNIRPGQTYFLKSVPSNPGPRPRPPTTSITKILPNSIRMNRPPALRHPAPLPDVMKQYQPPNWKALPPAPALKLAKADNGIVVSWSLADYKDASYEEISSYQVYAYQETSSPPTTALWKKIGDVKALPLPMACTLTQFNAGFKYYFAVRAVDVKSRLGPFSAPGSIILLNSM